MLADDDHPMDSGRDDAEPKLVVVYRTRGVPWLLVPPLLIFAAVVAIIGYRRAQRSEFVLRPPVSVAVESTKDVGSAPFPASVVASMRFVPPDFSARPAIPDEPAPRTILEPEPVPVSVASTEPIRSPTPAPVLEAKPPREPVARAAVGFDPEALRATVENDRAVPLPPADLGRPEPPKPVEVPLDEQREAERRLAERLRLTDPKPEPIVPDARDEKQRRHALIDAARDQAAADRVPFHDDLKRLISDQGNGAGLEIQQLCTRYGRDTLPEIHWAMNRDLVGPAARLSPKGRIQRMRVWGVPETIILDDLVEAEMQNLRTRGGPRTPNEAWARAARQLIAVPPPPVRRVADEAARR